MPFDLSKEYAVDHDKEVQGEYYYLDADCETYLLIARTGNERFTNRFKQLPKRIQVQWQNGNLPDSEMKKHLVPIIADTILLDWKGIANNGKEIPYNRENAIKALSTHQDFLLEVLEFANDRYNFLPEEEQDDEKNSEVSSPST